MTKNKKLLDFDFSPFLEDVPKVLGKKKRVFCDFLKNDRFYPKFVVIFRFYDEFPSQKCIHLYILHK